MQQAYPVSAVVEFIKQVLEGNEILSDVWISGEVTGFSMPASGHRYFTLKDESSQLRSVWFRSRVPGMKLGNGDRVLAHGRVSVYQQRGELQFVCDFVRPEGQGLLAAKYEELKARLEEEGLFDPMRKRPLPPYPRKIGVVTSPTGAALQDVLNVLRARWPLAEVVLSPTLVQGEQAPGRIVAAMRSLALEEGLDLAILARGGGSAEDLWAFNDEAVVRAVFGFPVPVVTGVGHETDTTLVDFVADLLAPTPSVAAERSTPDRRAVLRTMRGMQGAMAWAAKNAVSDRAMRVEEGARRLGRARPNLGLAAAGVEQQMRMLAQCFERQCATDRARYEGMRARVAGLDPVATLKRGFAVVEVDGASRRVVRSTQDVTSGDRLRVSVADGTFESEVR